MESLPSRREEILDAAAEAFMTLGFAATSIDSICAALGLTKGSVYYHFRSKSDLFFAVHRRAMERTRVALTGAAPDAPPAERLHAMAFAHAMLIMEHLPDLRVAALGLEMHLMVRTTAAERADLEELVALRDANERLYVAVIEEGVARGVFRKVDPRLASKPLLGALNWTSRWYQPRPRQRRADRAAIATELADFVLGGLLHRSTC
ncbi:TetR family transcriptional regulator [Belnapia sp. T6]|uniref:TetR family transcriptional regulator n=1 Tax=Belnapia mucosa TaxID=2804532 RepID=A0ABS1V3Q9_9PROT|nr:TetR/AcrR family transcriptional regulator [Belnapia mucosa]MBL6456332.1 TetR family transcriptional regulator [Belnapia mucosa]